MRGHQFTRRGRITANPDITQSCADDSQSKGHRRSFGSAQDDTIVASERAADGALQNQTMNRPIDF